MSFWKKLAKIALIAAPIAAAPFTGGASLALIGAAAGAARGAMDGGGVKGALMGGAMGAIPGVGGVGKGATELAKSGIKAGLTEAAKKAALSPSVWSQIAGAAGPTGQAIGAATSAAGQIRLNQQNLSMQGNRDNVGGNVAAENALMGRSEAEAKERASALADVRRASDAAHQNISEFNTRGPRQFSDNYKAAMSELEKAGLARLQQPTTYSTDKMTPLRTYEPLDIKHLQESTNTAPSLMERIGQYAAPALTTYGALAGQAPLAGVRRLPMEDDNSDFAYGG